MLKEKRVSPRRVLTLEGPGTLHAENGCCCFVELDTPTHNCHCGFVGHEPILPMNGLRKGHWFTNDEVEDLL